MPEKEVVTEDIARHYLRVIEPGWKRFWFHMHLMAKDLEEFAAGMAEIDDQVYRYHCSGDKHDFVGWVQEVVGDSVLARQLQASAGREESARILKERVEFLKRSLG